jgi:hypothetical protein
MAPKANVRVVNFSTVQDSSGGGQGPEWNAVSFSASKEDAMTDISATAPIPLRRLKLPRIVLPGPAIGATLEAITLLIGNALDMAYVQPYSSLSRRLRIIPDDDLEGRDPDW